MWNSITNPNSYRYGDGYTDCDRNADCNCDGHSYTYSYPDSKADTDSETYAHTEASPNPTSSSVTGNTRLEKSKGGTRCPPTRWFRSGIAFGEGDPPC